MSLEIIIGKLQHENQSGLRGSPRGEIGQAEAGDDDDAGHWSCPGDGDHGETHRHLTLSGPGKEQSGGGEELTWEIYGISWRANTDTALALKLEIY